MALSEGEEMNTKKKVRKFIINNFLFGDGADLKDNTSLMEAGVIDSTGILEIIGFIEKKYKFQPKTEELTVDNFDSINQISDYIKNKIS